MKFSIPLAALTLLIAAPAFAQPPAAPAVSAAAVSDEQVSLFAKFLVKRWQLQTEGKGEDRDAILDAVNAVGLNGATYNAITTAMANDPAVNARIQAAYQREVAALKSAQAGASPVQE